MALWFLRSNFKLKKSIYSDHKLENLFASIVPLETHNLPFKSDSIIWNGNIIELPKQTSDDKKILFYVAGFFINHNIENININTIFANMKRFLSWLLDQPDTSELRFDLLRKYESFRVKYHKVKTQSSGLKQLKTACKHYLRKERLSLSSNEIMYLRTVISLSKLAPKDSVIPDCLTNSFSVPWLRKEIGAENYLKLASPKIVINSFIIAISSLLISLIDIKLNFVKGNMQPGEKFSDTANRLQKLLNETYLEGQKTEGEKNSYAFSFIEMVISTYGSNIPILFQEIILLDLIDTRLENCSQYISDILSSGSKIEKMYFDSPQRVSRTASFARSPALLNPNFLDSTSHIEQQLFSIICAWWTIQPSDISQLSIEGNHIGVEHNTQKVPIFVHCNYYKSRSNYTLKQPVEIPLTQIEGKAIHAYIEMCKLYSHKGPLVSKKVCIPAQFHANHQHKILLNLLSLEEFQTDYENALTKRSASNVVLKALQIMSSKGDSIGRWLKEKNRRGSHFNKKHFDSQCKKPLPRSIYTLQGIKNSSIYSQSDLYREGDLQDKRSHSSATEGTEYMTDKNKEWLNINGRITRLVLNDLQSNFLSEQITHAIKRSEILTVRTRVVTGNNDVNIKTNIFPVKSDSSMLLDQIIVHDSEEAVIQCIHYYEEFKKFGENLLAVNPEFTLNTALPNAIWAEEMLKNGMFSANILRDGEKLFNDLREYLPSIFSNHLKGLY